MSAPSPTDEVESREEAASLGVTEGLDVEVGQVKAEQSLVAASSPAAEDEDGDRVTCVKCSDVVSKENAIWTNRKICTEKVDRKSLWKCKACNAMGMVLYRVPQNNQALQVQYGRMTKEQQLLWLAQHRADFDTLSADTVYQSLNRFISQESVKTRRKLPRVFPRRSRLENRKRIGGTFR